MRLTRLIDEKIKWFYENEPKKALLIDGARQVGKTNSIRQFGNQYFKNFIEINFLDDKNAEELFNNAKNANDILFRLSAYTSIPLERGETLIFFDEVQECKSIVTAIKFLVEEGSYRYILSGSLLGVELNDLKSPPVGYLSIYQMYPMNFYEFCLANSISEKVMDSLKNCFDKRLPVDSYIHERMLSLFELYLIIGGMPAAVDAYISTNNLQVVSEIQKNIILLYKKDISKYDYNHKLYIDEIYDLIPSELNSKNKRFILKNLNENFKFNRYEHSFIWLKDAGVAIPTYNVDEPKYPLLLSKRTNLFKLFLSDVGLLAQMYGNEFQLKILNHEVELNNGAIWENAVVQELFSNGFNSFYFYSKKYGEIDFLIEHNQKILPIEVKSGNSYKKHAALNNVLNEKMFDISEGIVLCKGNIEVIDKIFYCPIYLSMFIQNKQIDNLIYKIDLSGLQD